MIVMMKVGEEKQQNFSHRHATSWRELSFLQDDEGGKGEKLERTRLQLTTQWSELAII